MSAGPNPVDRLEQAAKQFKNSGVIQLAVQGLLLEGVARDLRRCDAATVGCVELSAWLNRGIRELERRKRIVGITILAAAGAGALIGLVCLYLNL